jgi:lipoprotein-releasing system permease protein
MNSELVQSHRQADGEKAASGRSTPNASRVKELMMFELSVAYKYLIPRWRQLSVSIISLVSTLVIALVVWLIVVFFSVKDGLEKSWIDKITALTAPVRITPTEKYYHSYYYLADTISANSDYTTKTIGEKLHAPAADPYNAASDEEVPHEWQAPDLNKEGQLKDLVKSAFLAAASIPGVKATDYESTVANLRLRLLRNIHGSDQYSQQFLEHASLIGTFDPDTPAMIKALIPPSGADFNHLLHMQEISQDNIKEETPTAIHTLEKNSLYERLQHFFHTVEITSLVTPPQGWRFPLKLLSNTELLAVALFNGDRIAKIIIPADAKDAAPLLQDLKSEGRAASSIILKIDSEGMAGAKISGREYELLPSTVTILLEGGVELPAQLIEKSVHNIKSINRLQFIFSGTVQGHPLIGYAPLGTLEIAKAKILHGSSNNFIAVASSSEGIIMPSTAHGDPVLLPKGFRESGALIGDQGYLSYFSPTPSAVQEQRIPVYVAGFYDPGIMPIGGKFILVGRDLAVLIRGSYQHENTHFTNGINVRFGDIADAPKVKVQLQEAFQQAGIAPYWHIETYQDFEFSKDIIQQLKSEKNLFSLISLVIIVVACSNIISMLIILVNDKKLEIGIMRSMGASCRSIALIFGVCGMVMGTIGSLVGILASLITLRYVNELVGFMSRIQGHDLFNPVFYGSTLPTELSLEALMFVIMTTVVISLLAGLVPAFKASMMRPSAILRSE